MSGNYSVFDEKNYVKNKIQLNQESEEFFNACDLLLIKLYLRMDVVYAFPDVSLEMVQELQKLELIKIEDSRFIITHEGKLIVQNGGLKKALGFQKHAGTDVLLVNKTTFLLDYPVVTAIIIGFLMVICILTWLYSL